MRYSFILPPLLVGIIFGAIFTFFVIENLESIDSNVGERFLSYENTELSLRVLYPDYFNDIYADSDKVAFRIKDNVGTDGWDIKVTPTTFSSTEEWLAAQPVGDKNAPGIKVITKIGGTDKYIISNFTQVDSDNGTPIYGQVLSGVLIFNGRLYEFGYHNQIPATATPEINGDFVKFFVSMKSL